MASQEQLDLLISVGKNMMIDKQVIVAVVCTWVYDYFLMLRDEIRCAWPGRKSPVFLLFLANRYWPLPYMIWLSVSTWSPSYTRSMCNHTAWLHSFYYTLVSVFAQMAITLRVYAVTGKNRWMGASLSMVTFAQFVFTMYLGVRFALEPALQFPDVPLEPFQLCVFNRWRPGELTSTAFSLLYDVLAFGIVVHSSRQRSRERAYGMPNILDRIVRDATMYFMVIFTSHLLLIFFELFAPDPMQLLPASANSALVPLMATRLMLSLKRAAGPTDTTLWSFHDPEQRGGLRFATRTIGGSGRGGDTSITLRDLSTRGRPSTGDSTG